jgi:hypothetical protein
MVGNTAEGDVIETGKLEWLEESTTASGDELVDAAGGPERAVAVSEAKDWLERYLRDQGAPTASDEVKTAAQRSHHSLAALHRARKVGDPDGVLSVRS